MFYRRKSLLGGLVVAALIFGACQAGPSGAPSEPAGTGATPTDAPSVAPTDKRLVFASRETIDSAFAVETDDAFALHFMGVAETLARTSFDGLLEPALATAWERTGDLTWEFTLREGVTFHDGTPFDADAVASALTYLLGVDAPARSFNPSTFTSVEAEGSNVVRVTSAQPNVLVPYYLASPNTIILAKKAYGGDQIDPIEAGTGPFVMTAMNLPESVALDRNPDYWGGSVALAGADIQFIPEGGTRATLVQTGEAQLADSIPIPVVPTLEADPNLTVIRGALQRTNTLYINNGKEPFTDVRVRQAIQSAIDVDAIANAILEGAVAPAIGPFSPTAAWAPAGAQPIARDLDKATALLADAGIEPDSLTVGLWAYPSRPELPDVAVAIQSMLGEIGINVEVRVADYAALEPDVLAGNFDMMLVSRSYVVDVNDPIAYLRSDYSCEGTYNLSHFCDEAVDDELAAALTNEDSNARYETYSEIATRLQADAVDVFLYNPQEISAISKLVQNYRIHPLQHFVLTPELALGD